MKFRITLEDFAAFMYWVAVFTLLAWSLGKSFGLIHSPMWVQMIPYSTVAVAFAGGGYKLTKTFINWGKHLQKIDTVCIDMKEVKNRLTNVENRLTNVETDVSIIKCRAKCLKTY